MMKRKKEKKIIERTMNVAWNFLGEDWEKGKVIIFFVNQPPSHQNVPNDIWPLMHQDEYEAKN